jgi:hypothetical protein
MYRQFLGKVFTLCPLNSRYSNVLKVNGYWEHLGIIHFGNTWGIHWEHIVNKKNPKNPRTPCSPHPKNDMKKNHVLLGTF